MPSPFPTADLEALGRDWVAAWNAGDLERVLKLYADDCEMSSTVAIRLGAAPDGIVRGKEALRRYWAHALAMITGLHFTLIDTFVSPDSLVVFYANERGQKICEYLRLNAAGKIVQGSANHLGH
ncbi:nuclear transport factor 2 family protein [Bradyrhizobium sp. 2TAF24]|uniref:nuclear transport factor 2 family protein n=1 Tax=Bradyrhizobium sp. 2TAF24 TaxID=3233011 RepID=UPI003F93F6B3